MGFYTNERIHVCPVETALELLSGRWKARILWKLHQNTLRYGELRRQLPRISEKMLIQQLRELEADGLVVRTLYPQVPPKVEYSLSEFGATLRPILDGIAGWGMDHQSGIIEILEKQTPLKTGAKAPANGPKTAPDKA